MTRLVKLLLETKAESKHRKLNVKKQEQLNGLYFETFCSVVNDLDLAKHKIEFIKIEVPLTLLEQVVYWKSTGTDKDAEIERALEESKVELASKMSNTLFGSNVPSIRFVADRTHLVVEEMNYLFEIADYGMSYRALSHTGRILGSTADSGKPEARKKVERMEMAKTSFQLTRQLPSIIRLSEEVNSALNTKAPVVALETTVLTHGLPYPKNLEVAHSLEDVIRQEGATPATIGLMNGRIHVGMNSKDLELLSDPNNHPLKVSSRDIPSCLSHKRFGGTTVAATMKIGGIGGVHRGANSTFDISADLVEMSRSPVAVVCAGAKSILDVPKTLELLETLGVNVITFGDCDRFPGFFSRYSNLRSPFCTDDIKTIAEILKHSDELDNRSGTLIACPLPCGFENKSEQIERAVDEAIEEANELKLSGKPLTPFLLKRVNELTQSTSLEINVALLKNNAKIATQIANEYVNQQRTSLFRSSSSNVNKEVEHESRRQFEILCVGAAIFEYEFIAEKEPKFDGGSYSGQFFQRAGGVARNHAECFQKLQCKSPLISVVGDDLQASLLFSDSDTLEAKRELFEGCDYVLLDSNLSIPTLRKAFELCKDYNKKVWLEPTDSGKVNRFVEAGGLNQLNAFSPNSNEFFNFSDRLQNADAVAEFLDSNSQLVPNQLEFLIVTLGPHGVVALSRNGSRTEIQKIGCPKVEKADFVSVSGAGDCFNSAFLVAHLHGAKLRGCLEAGTKCAELSLRSTRTVPEDIRFERVVQPFL
ncbi:hypothetical protein M3Y98_01069700 [Aphelenchoides besseyi]|nr:hypothetical protein M3Y98_01069700 [Aphelenchoides besseyi]